MIKNPGAIVGTANETSSTPVSKKRSRPAPKSFEKPSKDEVVDEEDGEEEEDAEEEPQGAHYGFAPQPPSYSPYAASHNWSAATMVNAYHPPYPTYPYQPMEASPKPKRGRSMSKSKSGSHSRTNASNAEEYAETGNRDDENEEASDLEEVEPKAKRRKVAAYSEASSSYSWPAPVGLQPPTMEEVPLGYHGSYQTPWWANTAPPALWNQPQFPPQRPSLGQDNATLWAYYYYGYAMGQYDAYNTIKKR